MTAEILEKPEVQQTVDLSTALTQVAQRLLDILTKENALIKERNIDAIIPLQEEKQRLLGAYENAIHHLTESQPVVLSEECRQLLKELHAILKENKKVVKAARDARRFVVKAIRDAAAAVQTASVGYNPAARPRQSSMAFAYNQQA